MKRLFLPGLFIALSCIFQPAFSQEMRIKLGKVSDEDLMMEFYSGDSTASAVVLADYGVVEFQNLDEVRVQRHLRIKILKKAGLDWGTFTVPFLGNARVAVKGFIFNVENGRQAKTKIRREHRQSEKLDDAGHYRTTVTFPNVKVGTVIDFEYAYTSEDISSPVNDWVFQRDIPIREQEVHFWVPEYLFFSFRQKGYGLVQSKTESGISRQMTINGNPYRLLFDHKTFYAQGMPALPIEPFVATMSDYVTSVSMEIDRIQFSGRAPIAEFKKTWFAINEELYRDDNFGGYLKGNRVSSELAKSLTAGASSAEEKIEILMDYMKSKFTWDNYFGLRASETVRKVMDDRKGSVAELHLLLTSMLKDAGVEAYPVWISTRKHGEPNPFFIQYDDYNYVMVYAMLGEGKGRLLDVTNPNLPNNMIPFRCRNGVGRLMDGVQGIDVPLTNGERNIEVIRGGFTLDEFGAIEGELSLLNKGYRAVKVRGILNADGNGGRVEGLASEYTGWDYDKYRVIDELNEQQLITEKVHASSQEAVLAAEDRLYVDALLGYGLNENPFESETRLYPVNMGVAQESSVMLQIKLPEGYEIEELPENAAFSLPDGAGSFRLSFIPNDGMVTVVSKMKLNKEKYGAEEYPALREFVNLVIDKSGQQIVLKKKV